MSFSTIFTNKENEFVFATISNCFPPYILATRCRRPLMFQTMNSVRSNSLSLKYHRCTTSGCKNIGIRKFEFVAKTQFLLVSKALNMVSNLGFVFLLCFDFCPRIYFPRTKLQTSTILRYGKFIADSLSRRAK